MILAWWQNLPLFLVLCPLMCGVACSALRGKASRCVTAAMCAAESAGMAVLLWYTASGNVSFTYAMGEIGAPFGNELRAGPAEALMGLGFTLVLTLSVTGGNRSLTEDVESKRMNLFGAMIGLLIVFTNDLFTAYVFIEITTLSACALIGVTNRGRALFSSARYMVMNLLGSGLFLLGLSMLYALTGQLLFPQLASAVDALIAENRYSVPMYLSFLLMGLGLCIKSALYPFHTWLPDAYSNATAVSGALLSSLGIFTLGGGKPAFDLFFFQNYFNLPLVLTLSVTGGNRSLTEDVESKRMNLFGAMIGLLRGRAPWSGFQAWAGSRRKCTWRRRLSAGAAGECRRCWACWQ